MKVYVKSAINPATVSMIAEVAGPIIIELIEKFWEKHQDEIADEIADEAITELEDSNDSSDSIQIIKDLIVQNSDVIFDTIKQLIVDKLETAK